MLSFVRNSLQFCRHCLTNNYRSNFPRNNDRKGLPLSIDLLVFSPIIEMSFLFFFLGPRGPLVEPLISPPVRNNFSWVHRWVVTLPSGLRYPSNRIFYESWWCQLSNSDKNTNTKTNTDTNTNTETNKGKTNDSYDVIYCLKGDDKRILNMICYRQRL